MEAVTDLFNKSVVPPLATCIPHPPHPPFLTLLADDSRCDAGCCHCYQLAWPSLTFLDLPSPLPPPGLLLLRNCSSHSLMLPSVFLPRLIDTCHAKCISSHLKEETLAKGEAVCIDRCVAKFLEVHESVGKRLTEMQAGGQQPTPP